MMHGRAFLEFARSLDEQDSEASRRSQISRAYYAAFLEARQYSQMPGLYVPSRRPQEHAEVASGFGSVDRQLQFDLASLRAMGNGADYDLQISAETVVLQAEEAMLLSASIIQRIDALASVADEDEDVAAVEEPVDP